MNSDNNIQNSGSKLKPSLGLWEILKQPLQFYNQNDNFEDWYSSIAKPVYVPDHTHIYQKIQNVTFFYNLLSIHFDYSLKMWVSLLLLFFTFKFLFQKKQKQEMLFLGKNKILRVLIELAVFLIAKTILSPLSRIFVSQKTIMAIFFSIYIIFCHSSYLKILTPFIIGAATPYFISYYTSSYIAFTILISYETVTFQNERKAEKVYNQKQLSCFPKLLFPRIFNIILLLLSPPWQDSQGTHPLIFYLFLISLTYVIEKVDWAAHKFKRPHRNECDMNFVIRQYY